MRNEELIASLCRTCVQERDIQDLLTSVSDELAHQWYREPVNDAPRLTGVALEMFHAVRTAGAHTEQEKTWSDIKEQIATLPRLHMTLARALPDESLALIHTAAQQYCAGPVILALQYDRTLLAGATIVWNNRELDCSLLARIEGENNA